MYSRALEGSLKEGRLRRPRAGESPGRLHDTRMV